MWTPGEGWTAIVTDDPLTDLDERLRARRPLATGGLPRLWGGAVGYFGYDVVRQVEHLPDEPEDDLGLPDGLFMFMDVVLAIDNLLGRAMAIATVEVEGGLDDDELRRRYDEAAAKTQGLVDQLAEGASPPPLVVGPEPTEDPQFSSTMTARGSEITTCRFPPLPAQDIAVAGSVRSTNRKTTSLAAFRRCPARESNPEPTD